MAGRCQKQDKKNSLVLYFILLMLVLITACGGTSSGNSSGTGGTGGNPPPNNSQGSVISTVAGNGIAGYSGDGGQATQAELNQPNGVSVDAWGNLYFSDSLNNRVRKIVPATGIIQTVAGNGAAGYSGDGGRATQAELNYPTGVAVDGSGNVYIADFFNNRVREVLASTGTIQTIAGTGINGFSGDGGPATQAQLNQPGSVAVDSSGNIFIVDQLNWRVREVDAGTGIIQTVVTQSGLDLEQELFVDGSDDIFIAISASCYYDADGFLRCPNGGSYIEKIDAGTSTIQLVAGNGTAGFSGDGGAATEAELNCPSGVAVDSSGNIYIADSENNRIRQVLAATGIIQTIAGNGTPGFSGDGGSPIQAELWVPGALTIDSSGNIFIADFGNQRIRKLTLQ